MPWNKKTTKRDRKVKARDARRKRNVVKNNVRKVIRMIGKLPPGVIVKVVVNRLGTWEDLSA